MERRKNIIIVVLILIILFLLGIIFGVVLRDKTTKKEKEPEKETTVTEVNTDEVLSGLVGEWGMCLGEYNCRGIIISKDNDKYYYSPYIMWSEFGQAGEIQSITKTEGKEYEITVHYAGYENELSSAPEETVKYKISISDLPLAILYVGGDKYQKMTTDRETFFNSINK